MIRQNGVFPSHLRAYMAHVGRKTTRWSVPPSSAELTAPTTIRWPNHLVTYVCVEQARARSATRTCQETGHPGWPLLSGSGASIEGEMGNSKSNFSRAFLTSFLILGKIDTYLPLPLDYCGC